MSIGWSKKTLCCAVLAWASIVAGLGVASRASAVPRTAHKVQPVSFVSPRPGLVRSSSVLVVVRTAARLKSFYAALESRNITRSFRREAPGRWEARLTAKSGLRPGAEHIIVSTTGAGGARGFAALRFIFGRRKAGFITFTTSPADSAGDLRPVTIRLGAEPTLFQATLNGRHATRLFPGPGLVRRAELAGDDGMRFGTNHLQILAALDNGTYDAVELNFVVGRDRPIPGAGAERVIATKAPVTLTAGSSLPAHASDALRYSWKVIRAPRSVHPLLRGAHTKFPRLITNMAGTYRVRLTVTELTRGAHGPGAVLPSSDVVTLTSIDKVYPPIGVPVETEATQPGGGLAVKVGTHYYPFGTAQVLVIVLGRTSLEALAVTPYAGTAAAEQSALSEVNNAGMNAIVIVSSRGGVDYSWNNLLTAIGADTNGNITASGWSGIGVPGSKSGGTRNVGDAPRANNNRPFGDITGYLQYDPTRVPAGYTFVLGDYASFNTRTAASSATQNVMLIGSQTYASGSTCPSGGGFQLVVVGAAPLTIAPYQGTFKTNCGSQATDAQALGALNQALQGVSGLEPANGPMLVFLQSIGKPYDGNNEAAWFQVGSELAHFGGTEAVFDTASGAYALAGSTFVGTDGSLLTYAPEASSSLTAGAFGDSGGSLSGLLRRDRDWYYEPVLGSPGGAASDTLPAIAYQPSTPWPFSTAPGTTLQGQQNALKYIAIRLNLLPSANSSCYYSGPSQVPDVRSQYCLANEDWGAEIAQIPVSYHPGHGFSAADWAFIRPEIMKEMGWVAQVRSYITDITDAYGPTSSGLGLQIVNNATSEIDQALAPPPQSQPSHAGFWTSLAGSFLDVAALIAGPAEGIIAGAGSIAYLVGDLMDLPDGSPELETNVNSDSEDLAYQLATRYQDLQARLSHAGDIIVTDYGKLKTVGTGSQFQYSGQSETALTAEINFSTYRYVFGKLLSAAYHIDQIWNNQGPNPNSPPGAQNFVCYYRSEASYDRFNPFASATAAGQFTMPQVPVNTAFGVVSVKTYVVAGPGNPADDPSNPFTVNTPPARVMDPLFLPADYDENLGPPSGYGLYPYWFYIHDFGRTSQFVSCGPA